MPFAMRLRPVLLLLLAVVACSATLPAQATAGPGLFVGLADDHLKSEPERAAQSLGSLGVSSVRLTVTWDGSQAISGSEAADIARASGAGAGVRVVVSVYSRTVMPLADQQRDAYCAYVLSIFQRFPEIDDAVIWNEPNKSTFWRPQFSGSESAAPRAYAELLARCYDVLHTFDPTINVIHAGLSSTGNDRPGAASNVSHSPGNFIRQEGLAYRSMHRNARLFDTFGMHPYGETSSERPWKRHDASSTIGLGDWQTLMQALWDGFHGTAQPIPGEGTPIWYLEIGWQTVPSPSKHSLYSGSETEASPVPDLAVEASDSGEGDAPDQATQFTDAIRLAYCQPFVDAIFSFLLVDEPALERWQSGVLWTDWTPKGSFAALQHAITEVKEDRVDCSVLKGGPVKPFTPRTGVEVLGLDWPKTKSFNWKNNLWRFRIQTDEQATYRASLTRLGGGHPVLAATGELRRRYFVFVKFPERRLPAGRYVMQVTLRSGESPSRETTLRSPVFVVQQRR